MFVGVGYVESSRVSWLVDGRCRRFWAIVERLVGSRWVGNGFIVDGLIAFDYVVGRLIWIGYIEI